MKRSSALIPIFYLFLSLLLMGCQYSSSATYYELQDHPYYTEGYYNNPNNEFYDEIEIKISN